MRTNRLNALRAWTAWGLPVVALIATAAIFGDALAARSEAEIAWCPTVEVARGGGQRGPWRQNESRYDYVDDPTVAVDARGAAAVAWVDQRLKDVFFQTYSRKGKPRLVQPVNVSRSRTCFRGCRALSCRRSTPTTSSYSGRRSCFPAVRTAGTSFSRDRAMAGRPSRGRSIFRAPSAAMARVGSTEDVWHNGSLDLAIAADGTLYAAWTEYHGALWFSRSTDRGGTFCETDADRRRRREARARPCARCRSRGQPVRRVDHR